MKRLPPFAKLAILSATAAGIAYAIGNLDPNDIVAPVPAAVTAVAVTATTSAKAWKTSVVQVLGIAFGAGVALAAVAALGYSALSIAVMVLVSYAIVAVITRYLDVSAPEAAASIAVSVIIVVGSHLSTSDTFDRFLGVVVGAVVGFVISLFSTTNGSLDEVAVEVDDLYGQVAHLTADMSADLAAKRFDQAARWYDSAVTIRGRFRALTEPLNDLSASTRYSPLMSRRSVERLQKRYESLGMTITRLVAVTSDLKLAQRKHLLDDAPTQVLAPLSSLLLDASHTLDPSEVSASRKDMGERARRTIEVAAKSDLDTDELAVISGVAMNTRRLVSLEDTQPLDPIQPD